MSYHYERENREKIILYRRFGPLFYPVLLLCFALILLEAFPMQLNAQDTCIGYRIYFGVPHWWDNIPVQPGYYKTLDDPRWTGCSAITYDDGTSEKVLFRAVHDNTDLYLSWRYQAIPSATPDQNALYLGIQRPAAQGGGDMIIRVTLNLLTVTEAEGINDSPVPLTLYAFLRDSATGKAGSAVTPLLTWLEETAMVWINSPTANSFAVQVRIPISAISFSGSTFKMWYQLLAGSPTAPVTKFTWPRSGVEITEDTVFPFTDLIFPGPGVWDDFRLSTGYSDPNCTVSGVSLNPLNFGTRNPNSSQILYLKVPPNPGPKPVNTFFAKPLNNSGIDIPPGGILATFRIANWGSVPGPSTISTIDDVWPLITYDVSGIQHYSEDIPNANTITSGTLPSDTDDIHFDWTLTNAQITPIENNTMDEFQCMLVELKSNMGLSGPGLMFSNRSYYKNMQFVEASTFARKAEISIKGLTPFSPQGRDVYIYVETVNMPKNIDIFKKSGVQLGNARDTEEDCICGKLLREYSAAELNALAANGRISPERFANEMPTYRVHVFHDTGKFITLGGVRRPVLDPQGSFGYYVSHLGDLEGWRHRFESDDVELTELAPNWYKISLPNDGVAEVNTTFKALERDFAISVRLGRDFSHGNFDNITDPALTLNVGLEYLLNRNFSLEAVFGYHRFTEGELGDSDLDIYQFSINGRNFFNLSDKIRSFINGGAGLYKLHPGKSKFGWNVGAGFDYYISNTFQLETAYNYHKLTKTDIQFSTVQGGFRLRF